MGVINYKTVHKRRTAKGHIVHEKMNHCSKHVKTEVIGFAFSMIAASIKNSV